MSETSTTPGFSQGLGRKAISIIRQKLATAIQFMRYGWGGDVPVPHLIKRREIRRYASQYRTRCFIETGTYLGQMLTALASRFDEFHSIELSEFYYCRAMRKLARQKNIHLYFGDSGSVLPEVLHKCHQPALFWLDAHYSGGSTARSAKDTPIATELTHILRHNIRGHVILIDDAGMFVGKDGYPSLAELQETVSLLRPDYEMSVAHDIIRLLPRANS